MRTRVRVKRKEESRYSDTQAERVHEKVRDKGRYKWRGEQGRGHRDSDKRREGSR